MQFVPDCSDIDQPFSLIVWLIGLAKLALIRETELDFFSYMSLPILFMQFSELI